jgi:NAD+ synthase (glutamine-hydrolysing)
LKKIRVALAQINPTVGDIPGNTKKVITYIRKAKRAETDIVAFPELVVTGYPPEDLLLKQQFVNDNIKALDKIREASKDIVTIVGFVDKNDGIYNASAIISNCEIVDIYHKKHLPNYGVFDECRYFMSGKRYPIYNFNGINFGVSICEDIWYEKGPPIIQAMLGAEMIININASPYHMKKSLLREDYVSRLARQYKATFVYINMVGGQDELVFDGGSFVADSKGNVIARGEYFKEELIITDIEIDKKTKASSGRSRQELKSILGKDEIIQRIKLPGIYLKKQKPTLKKKKVLQMSRHEEIYNALLLGTRDYVQKNGFSGVVIGMSGGIDSSLVTTIAVDALGRENVHGLFMPSIYTSKESYEDAHNHARNLGIEIITISIDNVFKSYLKTLSKFFKGLKPDITEENLQARIRGNILMAFSNKFGWLVLTTGNKSEMSVGYATLYGDMAGGFAVIKDVPKTLVYELCKWRNEREGKALIPERILWKEPTAELKPDQRDTDSLPPYPLLDPILKAYVEEDPSFDEIIKLGCDIECTKRVIRMIDHSEYKRRQAPPGVKITPRAFGKDRRFPITNKYKSY